MFLTSRRTRISSVRRLSPPSSDSDRRQGDDDIGERRVLAQVTTVLGAHRISIASVLQHEPLETNGVVPLIIMTHETSEGAAARACDAIDKLPPVQGHTVRMWVRD